MKKKENLEMKKIVIGLVSIAILVAVLILTNASKRNDIYMGSLEDSEKSILFDMYDFNAFYIDNYKGQIVCIDLSSKE